MKTGTVETLTWLLIFGGLILVALGWSVSRVGGWAGHALLWLGGVLALSGVLLIYVRSRMSDSSPSSDEAA